MGIAQEVFVISPYDLHTWDHNLSLNLLRDLEDAHLDMYGDLLYESGSSRNPLSNALLQNSIYSKCRVYKDAFLSLNGSSTNQNLDFKSLPPHLVTVGQCS